MKRRECSLALTMLLIVVVFSAGSAVGAALVGHWAFDEGQGNTAQDSSGYANHGTIYNAVWVEGKRGYALSFNGESAYVQVPNADQYNMTEALSVEAWVLMTPWQSSGQPDVFDKSHRSIDEPPYYSGYVFQGAEAYSIGFFVGNGRSFTDGNYSGIPLNDSTWHFIAGTASTQDGLARFYLDGEMTTEVPFEGPIATNEGDLFIGRHYLLGRYFSGIIDEVKVYDGALRPEEVREHYSGYIPLVSIELVPDNPPVIVPRGGFFTYAGSLVNNTDQRQRTDVWVMVNVPDYGMYGPLMRFDNVRLLPFETITVENIRQDVPDYARPGIYDYIGYCGDYPANPVDSSSFEVTVTE